MAANIIDLATRRQAELEIVCVTAVTIGGAHAFDMLQAAKFAPEVSIDAKAFWPIIPALIHDDNSANLQSYFSRLRGGFGILRRWESVYNDLAPFDSIYDNIPWALKEIQIAKYGRFAWAHLAEALQREAAYAE